MQHQPAASLVLHSSGLAAWGGDSQSAFQGEESEQCGMGTALQDPGALGAAHTGTAGGPVHRNAVIWVIPWEFAIKADFRLLLYGQIAIKSSSDGFLSP